MWTGQLTSVGRYGAQRNLLDEKDCQRAEDELFDQSAHRFDKRLCHGSNLPLSAMSSRLRLGTNFGSLR